jgi:hypothetical protein
MGNYTATIGGQSVNLIAGTLDIQNQIGQRSTGSMRVWTNPGVFWLYGTRVLIYDGNGALAFAGYTTKDKAIKASRQGQGFLEHDITLMDNCYKADKRVVFYSNLNASAGQIVRDLLSRYLAAEGVTATASSIASGMTIPEVAWSGSRSVSSALDWLATTCGNWWNIDKQSVLWFQPYTGLPASFILDGSTVDSNSVSVEWGNDVYVNRQFAKGAYNEVTRADGSLLAETLYGDGYKRGFALSYPIGATGDRDLQIYDSSTGNTYTTKNGGISTKGSTGATWYVAESDAVVAQDPALAPLTSSQYITVSFKGRTPTLALASNSALIASQKAREGGGTGYVESVYTNTKVHTQAAAFGIASSLLAHYGQDMTVLTFSTKDTWASALAEGQLLTVNLSDFALANKQMLVSGVEISDARDGINIWYTVTCVGSPVEAAQWQTYWQALMNQSSDPTDLQSVDDSAGLAYIVSGNVSLSLTAVGSGTKHVCSFPSATLYPSTGLFPC